MLPAPHVNNNHSESMDGEAGGETLFKGEVIVYASGNVCDQCSVAAAIWVVALPSGRTIVLCGHHMRHNEEALTRDGALIYKVVTE